jgi:uncharacterized membrane protein
MSGRITVILASVLIFYGFCALVSFGAADANMPANRVMDADEYAAAGVMKFISWVGKFHPPATHFPIALIIAAAIAEVLFVRTGKTLFDNARQYCLWFGIIAAVGTGTLGWFLGGFELADENWLLTVHRWLGTSTVVCSLVLAFLAYRLNYRGVTALRRWYVAVLVLAVILVSATGFFGGAMLYGLNEFAW